MKTLLRLFGFQFVFFHFIFKDVLSICRQVHFVEVERWKNSIGELFFIPENENSIMKINADVSRSKIKANIFDKNKLRRSADLFPSGITGDTFGNLYITECQNNRILKLNVLPEISSIYEIELIVNSNHNDITKIEEGDTRKENVQLECPLEITYFLGKIYVVGNTDPPKIHVLSDDNILEELKWNLPSLLPQFSNKTFSVFLEENFHKISSQEATRNRQLSASIDLEAIMNNMVFDNTFLNQQGIAVTLPIASLVLSLSAKSDVNGDRITDLCISVAQKVYVLFGRSTLTSNFWVDTMAPSEGVIISGLNSAFTTVSSGGDANGDGYNHILIGASSANAIYLIYGGPSLTSLSVQTMGSNQGIKITGLPGNNTGSSVSLGGDVNGDGIGDMLIGNPGFTSVSTGIAYLIYGSASLTDLSIANLVPSKGIYFFRGMFTDNLGIYVAVGGDINGDGKADMVLSSYVQGIVYIVFGAANMANTLLGSMSSSQGIIITGASGDSTDPAIDIGDINADGFADILIGYDTQSSHSGRAYVVYGKSAGWADFSLTGFAPPKGIVITGPTTTGSWFGHSVAMGCDVNNDGYNDMLIGAYGFPSTSFKGEAFSLYGGANLVSFGVQTLTAVQGILLTGTKSNATGNYVAIGDLNDDGTCDLLISAKGAQNRGRVYIVYGDGNPKPTSQPSNHPSSQPASAPSAQPSLQPFSFPSSRPTRYPSSQPSSHPSTQPTRNPSAQPFARPSSQPSSHPSSRPSRQPTSQPSGRPSTQPTMRPSSQPTSQPSRKPSSQPSSKPSMQPSVQPTTQPSAQPANQPSNRPSAQPIGQPSAQPTDQPSSQPTAQPVSRPTGQPSVQPSALPSCCPSSQPSSRPTRQPTIQPSSQPSNQPSTVPSVQPSSHPTGQPSNQPSTQPSSRPSAQPSRNPTTQPSDKPSNQPSVQPSSQPSSQPSGQPSSRPTGQPTTQPSCQPSNQPSSRPTAQPSSQPTGQPSVQPSIQPSSRPSSQPSRFPTGQPSNQPSNQPTALPSRQPSAQPSNKPSRQPTSLPTAQPTRQPSVQPTCKPSAQPSRQPSTQPTAQPSSQPSRQPTRSPTGQPSDQPSNQPTVQPSSQPSSRPSCQPSSRPTRQPTTQPTSQPSTQPSRSPSTQPSGLPSTQPTSIPSSQPSSQPSAQPSSFPSAVPSSQPSSVPSSQPTGFPTMQPSSQPSSYPTGQPSSQPTDCPTTQPTTLPTAQPSSLPTTQPSSVPSNQPSSLPSSLPSSQPSSLPTTLPSNQPSAFPSGLPSSQPTGVPSSQPTMIPSTQPTAQPTGFPSQQPSSLPTGLPTSQPTSLPSNQPTSPPTCQPSGCPSTQPSSLPSAQPSGLPSSVPTGQPSEQPSSQPSTLPSSQPSGVPSSFPTGVPSRQPTQQPTGNPSGQPTSQPSGQPSSRPSTPPTVLPSNQPTSFPSSLPTGQPTVLPTSQPTIQPSACPSDQPTVRPSVQPSSQPTTQPTMQPFASPSSQPSLQPFSPPTSAPSNQPLSRPSSQPASHPTSSPSKQPTSQPTTQPVGFPTSSPVANIYRSKGVLFYPGESMFTEQTEANRTRLGSSYILFGRDFNHQARFPFTISLTSSSSVEYVSLVHSRKGGIENDVVTRTTTVLGDIDGDGLLDLLVGYPLLSKCFVYLGNAFAAEIKMGLESFAITGDPSEQGGLLGWSSTRVGDVNRDGFDEIAVSAIYANIVYFIFGKLDFEENMVLSELTNKESFKIIGSELDSNFGVGLTLVHDFNKDGYQDIAISSLRGSQSMIYVLFGNANFGKEDIRIDALNRNSLLKIIPPPYSFAGFSIAGIGDINSDGYNDLAIGSVPFSNGIYSTQKTYIIYGRENPFTNDLLLSELTVDDGFIIIGGGFLVEATDDVNYDGIADVMITGYYDWKRKGNAYLIAYPENVTYAPTFQPSSLPSSFPSFSPSAQPFSYPTSIPSLSSSHSRYYSAPGAIAFPTNLPTVEEINNNNNNNNNEFPVLKTKRPSIPSTMRPTLVPQTTTPTTYRPSVVSTQIPSIAETDSPSLAPSSILVKTPSPNTGMPFALPSKKPVRVMITPPTFIPTCQPSLESSDEFLPSSTFSTRKQTIGFDLVPIGSAGSYTGTPGNNNFLISGEGLYVITGNGGGEKIYTILPAPNEITITDFGRHTDVIDLLHFPEFSSLIDLPFKTNPLRIILSSQQQCILSSYESFDLSEGNFLFQQQSDKNSNTELENQQTFQKKAFIKIDLSFLVSLGIFFFCVIVMMIFVMGGRRSDEDDEKVFIKWKKQDEDSSDSDFNSLSSLEGGDEEENDSSLLLTELFQDHHEPSEIGSSTLSVTSSENEDNKDDEDKDTELNSLGSNSVGNEERELFENNWNILSSLKTLLASDKNDEKNEETDSSILEDHHHSEEPNELENDDDFHFIRQVMEGNISETQDNESPFPYPILSTTSNVLDPAEEDHHEKEDPSDLATTSDGDDDEFQYPYDIDVEGNYHHEHHNDLEENITFLQQLFNKTRRLSKEES
jgi:hypothetical protein